MTEESKNKAEERQAQEEQLEEERGGERIAKVMARAGLCSRRDAERWIEAGRVIVNGERLESPAFNVGATDEILVDGEPLPRAEDTRLFLHYKRTGLVTTNKDERGRETVFDTLPSYLPRLVSVGRLDLNTEGLLLLTNDGALSRYMELPETGWERRYRVRALGSTSQSRLESLKNGIIIDGVQYRPIEARMDRNDGANSWYTVCLTEGKNREVRRVMDALGLEVNRLIRVSYGPFYLGSMEKGEVREVPRKVLREKIPDFFK